MPGRALNSCRLAGLSIRQREALAPGHNFAGGAGDMDEAAGVTPRGIARARRAALVAVRRVWTPSRPLAETAPGGRVIPQRRRSDRHLPFETTLAVIIALISAVGGVVTWRADVWGALASHADREGIVNKVTVQSTEERAYTQALQEGRAFRVYIDAVLRAQTEPAGSAAHRADVTLTGLATAYFDPGAARSLDSPASATYDVEKRAADIYREAQVSDDSAALFSRARARHDRRSAMLDLDVVLAFGLGFAALGQVCVDLSRRRLGLVASTTTLLGATVVLLAVGR